MLERLSFGCGQVTLASWNARLADEEWKTDPKENKLLGRRVRRPFGYGFAKGRIVAYLPEGKLEEEEYEMWHVIHDHDGDHEDLEKAEIELAIQAWEEYTEQENALATAAATSLSSTSASPFFFFFGLVGLLVISESERRR